MPLFIVCPLPMPYLITPDYLANRRQSVVEEGGADSGVDRWNGGGLRTRTDLDRRSVMSSWRGIILFISLHASFFLIISSPRLIFLSLLTHLSLTSSHLSLYKLPSLDSFHSIYSFACLWFARYYLRSRYCCRPLTRKLPAYRKRAAVRC